MIDIILSIAPLEWLGILSTMICGTIIGVERQILGKPVGIRTSILICLGTYIFVVVSNSQVNEIADRSRIIGQVVTGVGFLGAGVILSREGLVFGVTSASAIWVLSAIGVTIASQFYLTGIKLSIIAVIVLVGVDLIENTFKSMQHGVHAKSKYRKITQKWQGE